jgi:hypothetical protein
MTGKGTVSEEVGNNGTLPSASNPGPLSDQVSIVEGGSVVYEVTLTVPHTYPTSKLTNTASVTLNNLINDPNLLNNSDYDADKINPSVLPVNPHVRVKVQKIIR